MIENTCVAMNRVITDACAADHGRHLAAADQREYLNFDQWAIVDVLAIGGDATLLRPVQVVLVAAEEISVDEVFSAGAHDLRRHPLDATDVLWSGATAWHAWMNDQASVRGNL